MDTTDLDSYVKDTFGVDPGAYASASDADTPTQAAPAQDTPPAADPSAADPPSVDSDTPAPAQDAAPAGGDTVGLVQSGEAAQGQSPGPDSTDALADTTDPTPLDTPQLDAPPLDTPQLDTPQLDAPQQGGGSTGTQAVDGDSKLVLTDSSQPPTSITADTLNDFITQTNQVLGGNPHCAISQDVSFTIDEHNICTGVVVTIDTAIVRPRLGLSRASGKERDLINKAAGLIADHERQHRSIVQTSFANVPASMRGQTEAKARKTLATAMAAEDAAQHAFDAAHGRLVIVMGSDGTPSDVTTGPL